MTVVFVNHHSEALLAPKFAPLLDAGADVIVVDNSGTFPGAPSVRVIEPDANVGFARGCNLAVEQLRPGCKTVCFHNPDLSASTEMIARLVRRLEGQRRPGLVTPAIRVGNRIRRNGYRYPSPSREVLVGLRAIAHSTAGRGRPAGRQPSLGSPQRTRDVVGRGRRFGSGGLLVASREALSAVGGFDEDYFLYAEDLDLWHRIGKAGYVTEIDAAAVVDHDEATGGRMIAADREILRWLGVELFAERTGIGGWPAFRRSHRWLMPAMYRRGATLAVPVRRAWREGARPEEVQRQVRALLTDPAAVS